MAKCGSLSISACFSLLLLTKGVFTNVDIREQWNRQYVNTSDVSHQLVDSLRQIVMKLQWRRIIVIFDTESSDTVRELLLHQDLDILPASFQLQELNQELLSESAFKAFLLSVHQWFFPELNFILLTDYDKLKTLMKVVDSADNDLNRTTDFRHFSFWIQACTSVCQPPPGPHPAIHYLENVILLSPSEREGQGIRIWDLVTISDGRTFSYLPIDGDLSKMEFFQNTKYGLNNRTLIVSTRKEIIFAMKTRDGYEGFCIDVLKSLAFNMNFSYEIINPPGNEWGAETNGTWNGLVGQLQRREVDLVISTLSVHQDREKVMDFLYPPFFIAYDDIGYRLAPNDGVRWDIFFESYKSTVYVVLGASFLSFTVIAYTVMRYTDNYTMSCERVSGMLELFLYSLGMLLNRGVAVVSSRQSTRLLLFTWGVFSVIFAAAYSANLVAIFAVHRQQLPFKNLGELVRQTEYKWGFVSGNLREHIFRLSRNGDIAVAWKGILRMNNSDPDVLSPLAATHHFKLNTEKYALFTSRHVLHTLRNEDCRIRLVGEDIIMHQFAIGVPSGYPLSRDIEETLSTLADSGMLDKWWHRWGIAESDNCFQEDSITAFSLKDVASAFVLLFAGLGLSGIVLLIETFRKRCYG